MHTIRKRMLHRSKKKKDPWISSRLMFSKGCQQFPIAFVKGSMACGGRRYKIAYIPISVMAPFSDTAGVLFLPFRFKPHEFEHYQSPLPPR